VQVKPQVPALHDGCEFAGPEAHAAQDVPQLDGEVLDRHALPQAWKPVLQVKPHAVPSQVAVEFAGT
jgi:hypothetical protein